MKKILVKILLCDIMGIHEWTCDANKGIPPKTMPSSRAFYNYFKVYCDRCGKHSKFNF